MVDLGKIGYKVEIDDRKYTAILKRMDKNAEDSANRFAQTFKKAFAALGGFLAFREGVKALRLFSDELANIKTIAGEYDTGKLRKEITNLSSTLGTSAELANALYFAYSAGVRGSEKEMARFVGQVAALAKTIGAQVTPTMDAVTTMMNAYGLEVKDAGMLTDWFYQIVKSGKTTGPELAQSLGQIAATAAASGISLDELGAALATLTTTMPTNIAVTSLAASIRSLMNPTDDVRKQAAALGIDLSMAAIKAKGFGGVMEEIYNKTQGRGDLIGRLFPAESSRAIMALAGTQLNTLKQNIVDFGSKGGAAAVAFQEKMQSLDERIKALQVTGQKLLTLLADTVVQVITLGGALNPLLEKFVNIKDEGLALIARLTAIAAGIALLRKVQASLNLRARAADMTSLTSATTVQTAATDRETAAIIRQTAAIAANKAARNAPGGALNSDDFRRQDIQQRWDARRERNAARQAAQLGGGGVLQTSPTLKKEFREISKSAGAAVPPMRTFSESLRNWGKNVAGEWKQFGSGLAAMAKNTAKASVSLQSWTNGIAAVGKGITGALTGGLKGFAGIAAAASNACIALGTAIAGWELGKWLAEATGFKKWLADTWAGRDVDEWDRRNEREIKEREERLRKQDEEARKSAEDQKKQQIEDREARERLNRRNQALRDYQFGRADTQTRISMLNADLENARTKAREGRTDEERTAAQETYWRLMARLEEAKKRQEDELKARREAARETELAQYRNQLARDSELSKADELLLRDKEIEQQEQRIAEAAERVKKARLDWNRSPNDQNKRDQLLQSIREQENELSKFYELENRQRQKRIDLDNEQRSLRQQLEMNKLIIRLRQDGEYSISDQIDAQNLKLRQMADSIAAAKEQAKNLIGDAKAQMEVKISQLELDRLMAQLDLKKLKESGLKSNGGFSAELLNLMSGAQSPQREIADNTRKSLSETRKVRENLEKSPVLRYGSR